jgi:large subunit ribosomal protein L22
MIAKAKAKYLRLSPKKARLVLDLIKGKTVEEANYVLDNVSKRAKAPIKKVLNSAFANLNQNKAEADKVLSKDVYISAAKADSGPYLMRYRAATMGRATPIRHRTAHISVELDKIVVKKPAPRKPKTQARKGSQVKGKAQKAKKE